MSFCSTLSALGESTDPLSFILWLPEIQKYDDNSYSKVLKYDHVPTLVRILPPTKIALSGPL
jgi:hypothetical protein